MLIPAIPKSRWLKTFIFVFLLFVSVVVWFQFAYPRFTLIDLSVNRSDALKIARNYVQSFASIDLKNYKEAIIFDVPTEIELYLQKSLGFKTQEQFMHQHHLEMYFWTIRFFKEQQKEEYRVSISSKTGEIVSYWHILDDAAKRPQIDEPLAKKKASDFLQQKFGYALDEWTFHEENKSKYDHRVEHKFKWEKKGVYVPWASKEDQGGGKLLTIVSVSGDEIQSFVKLTFLTPQQFTRYLEQQKESGRNLSLIGHVCSLGLFMIAIWIMQVRRNHLCMNVTKFFYIYIIGILFLFTIAAAFNNAQGYLYSYPTTQPFLSFFLRQGVYELIDRFLFFGCFIIPSLAGELLRYENFPKKTWLSVFHSMSTSFFTRDVAKAVFWGYGFAVLMFGLQTIIFEIGYRYWGVWMEQERLSTFSTAYFPFFGILLTALSAGITEETFYRLFGVNFVYNLTKNTVTAFFIPSIIWGLGHTGYMVFPFWFRGLEVALLGVFTCFVYWRFGLLAVIVQHYLFDAFWGASVYLFARSASVDFWMSIVILVLPAVFGLIAFMLNRKVRSVDVQWKLTKQQKYNLEVVKEFIRLKQTLPGFNAHALRNELITNGWDIAVIDVAFQQINQPNPSN